MSDLGSWEDVLDRLESDVTCLEAMRAGAPRPEPCDWEPPSNLGPMPADLVLRARDLQMRQHAVIGQLNATLIENRQQARVTQNFRSATGAPERPAYVDFTA
ncbi:hypothetical protein F0U44_15590 [Nocardioides humilatus]|uniref:Flagellar protein FlgN n=1 Tax=Nocardioides humilatus TaxID=2607660 RepID=A0A5B1LAQ2_9ACTN|nr:hypothetical protein [Nocardioides humilatus]KAA1417715.1 hypothetical protein F0U44_15590 [Nocardioides humilatus]